jgi:hypothetical protein
MDFVKIKASNDGAARYINLEQVVIVEDDQGGFKLKLSNGEVESVNDAAIKANILRKIGPK